MSVVLEKRHIYTLNITIIYLKIIAFWILSFYMKREQLTKEIWALIAYVADTGNIYLSSLSNGDKFKNEAITYYDAVPGETYTLRFFEYSW